jgi:P pilus assembly chaperone PapD
MTPSSLTLFRRTLTFIVLVLSSLTTAQSQTATGETQVSIAKEGLEATLRLEACGENTVLTIAWKNVNNYAVVALLTVKAQDNQSLLLMTTARVEANAVKVETCTDVDQKSRYIQIADFSDVIIDLTLPNN